MRLIADIDGHRRKGCWWARQDSNLQPDGYEPSALTIELHALPGPPRLGRSGNWETALFSGKVTAGKGARPAFRHYLRQVKIELAA